MAKSTVKIIRKYVTPQPSKGPAGVVVPLAIGGGLIVGTWIIGRTIAPGLTDKVTETAAKVAGETATQVVKTATEPIYDWAYNVQKGAADWWNSLWGSSGGTTGGSGGGSTGGGGTVINLTMEFSRSSVLQGEIIGVAAGGFMPNAPIEYGWLPSGSFPGTKQNITADSNGNLTNTITILFSTPPGTYTVYFKELATPFRTVSKSLTIRSSGVEVSDPAPKQGQTIRLVAAGLQPNKSVFFYWNTDTTLVQLTSGPHGELIRDVFVAPTRAPGAYQLVVNQMPFGGPQFMKSIEVRASGT